MAAILIFLGVLVLLNGSNGRLVPSVFLINPGCVLAAGALLFNRLGYQRSWYFSLWLGILALALNVICILALHWQFQWQTALLMLLVDALTVLIATLLKVLYTNEKSGS